ncbi:hypothetical protein CsSME_00035928 [Camellia sinensis var. sinensis]
MLVFVLSDLGIESVLLYRVKPIEGVLLYRVSLVKSVLLYQVSPVESVSLYRVNLVESVLLYRVNPVLLDSSDFGGVPRESLFCFVFVFLVPLESVFVLEPVTLEVMNGTTVNFHTLVFASALRLLF